MVALRKERMTVKEFLPWARQQPERWELFDGVPMAMAPERVIHGDTKYRAARAFDGAIAKARVPCRFVLDSAAARIDARNSYQPDVLVYCGEPLSGDAVEVPAPVVVVEILSPGNAITDLRDKLQGYFRVASIHHYLVVDPDKRLVIRHTRGQDDVVTTRIVTSGEIALDPPGLSLAIVDFFGPTPA
ncbi:MAG TPA: Uma2 family endonuclease [Xanthobacteraceae bacterium]|nr:Uma2 family endonuclease [Xanthobacteraceae bacterium]